VGAANGNTAASIIERREIVTPAPVIIPDQGVAGEEMETLPQTASNQPLILLLSVFALGSAGLIMVVRGIRNI
jgi:LPXTG-motif cell wall-anchored protein